MSARTYTLSLPYGEVPVTVTERGAGAPGPAAARRRRPRLLCRVRRRARGAVRLPRADPGQPGIRRHPAAGGARFRAQAGRGLRPSAGRARPDRRNRRGQLDRRLDRGRARAGGAGPGGTAAGHRRGRAGQRRPPGGGLPLAHARPGDRVLLGQPGGAPDRPVGADRRAARDLRRQPGGAGGLRRPVDGRPEPWPVGCPASRPTRWWSGARRTGWSPPGTARSTRPRSRARPSGCCPAPGTCRSWRLRRRCWRCSRS